MTNDDVLADQAARQMSDTFALFVAHGNGEVRDAGNIRSYATGLPAFLANGCVIAGHTTPEALDEALNWVEERAQQYLVTIDDRFAEPLRDVLAERAIGGDDDPAPGMALHPIEDLPTPPADIELVALEASGYEDWLAIAAEIFLPAELARAIFPPSLLVSPICLTVLARLDGEFVGSATAVHTGDLAGIYSVGTLEHARRRGVGRATTAAVAAAARDEWGVDRVFLQSSAMGLPVYEGLGFRTVTTFHMLAGGLKPGLPETV